MTVEKFGEAVPLFSHCGDYSHFIQLELFPDADPDYVKTRLRGIGLNIQLVCEDFLNPDTPPYQRKQQPKPIVEEEPGEVEVGQGFLKNSPFYKVILEMVL